VKFFKLLIVAQPGEFYFIFNKFLLIAEALYSQGLSSQGQDGII